MSHVLLWTQPPFSLEDSNPATKLQGLVLFAPPCPLKGKQMGGGYKPSCTRGQHQGQQTRDADHSSGGEGANGDPGKPPHQTHRAVLRAEGANRNLSSKSPRGAPEFLLSRQAEMVLSSAEQRGDVYKVDEA